MIQHINRHLNPRTLPMSELRLGYIVKCSCPVRINGISPQGVEILEIFSMVYKIVKPDWIMGYPLFDWGGLHHITKDLLMDNGFVLISEREAYKNLPDGSTIIVKTDWEQHRWAITYSGLTLPAYYIHEFQKIYECFTTEELKTRAYEPNEVPKRG